MYPLKSLDTGLLVRTGDVYSLLMEGRRHNIEATDVLDFSVESLRVLIPVVVELIAALMRLQVRLIQDAPHVARGNGVHNVSFHRLVGQFTACPVGDLSI